MVSSVDNIFSRLSATAAVYGPKPALIDPTGTVSYEALLRRALGLAALTRQLSACERVGLFLPTSGAFGAAFYGVLAAGRTALPLNLLVSRETLEFIAQDSEIDLIYTVTPLRERVDGLADRIVCLDALPAGAPAPEGAPGLDAGVPAVLLYTSGTTAVPKGVPLTHRNILSNLEGFEAAFDFGDYDTFLAVLPMFHTFALTTTLVLPMSIGATTVCMPKFQPGGALELIEKHKATAIMSIASMYRLLMHAYEKEPRDVSTVRYWVAGGEPLPFELARKFQEMFSATLLEGYGLTETSPVVCVNRPDSNRLGTAGLALPNVAVRVVRDDGTDAPVDEEGELWVKGENVMAGYFRRPEDTAEVLTGDGWLKTGDIASIDADGFIKIRGRKKEFIIISGENVSPVEIENAVSSHPAVFEAGVVPVPDPRRGEVPVAFVSLVEKGAVGADELRAHCRKSLPPYKVPREVRILSELPHGPTGKVLRRALKEQTKGTD